MKKEQTGFVPQMSTHVNIKKLQSEIFKYKSKDNKTLIFIDYRPAFNSIDRSKLYSIIESKNILDPDELSYLKCLHTHVHYECGK